MSDLPERNINTAPFSDDAPEGVLGLKDGELVVLKDLVGPAEAAAERSEKGAERSEEAASRVNLGALDEAVEITGENKAITTADRAQTQADRAQTGADRMATGADRAVTTADRVQTQADRAQTGADRTATEADRAVTTADRAQTQADRAQTGADRTATEASAIITAGNAADAEAARDAAISAGAWDYTPNDAAALAAITGMTAGETALVRDTMHVWEYSGSAWVDTGLSPLDVKAGRWVEDSIGPTKFEQIPPDVPWMRVFKDAAENILGGFRRNGKLTVALEDDAQVPLAALNVDVSERLMNGATTVEIPNDSGWARVFKHDTFGVLGGFDIAGKFVADLSRRSIFPDGIGLPDGVKWGSGPAICCSGDSMTAGAGGGGTTYPSVLAGLTGRTVYNLGVGGETSSTIAGRLGAWPWLVTVAGGAIPASGGVLVTLENLDGVDQDILPLVQGSAGVNPCQIAGVTGTLTSNSGIFTFTRSASGSEVDVPYPVPFVPAGADRMSDVLILWWGQNDGTSDAAAIIARQRATIESMPVARRRYLVVGLPSGTDSNRTAMDLQFVREFGRRFVNIRKYLSSYAALAAAGISPTSQDDADIASGRVPLSLRSDDTHFNAAGYSQTANFIYARLLELGDLED